MEEQHSETCSTASLTSVCLCSCNGTRHGEGIAAARLAGHIGAGNMRVRVGGLAADSGEGRIPRLRANMRVVEAAPAPTRLRAMTDDELAAMFARFSREENWTAFGAVEGEMTARETESAWLTRPEGLGHWNTGGQPSETDRRIDVLLASGLDFAEAFGEVHGADPDRIRREERAALVDRGAGDSSVDAALRRAYDMHVYEQWIRAEADLRGHLLTREAISQGIDPIDLFSGQTARARRFASEDLQRWWAQHGRQTYTQFRAAALGRAADVQAAEKTRLASNARDFI